MENGHVHKYEQPFHQTRMSDNDDQLHVEDYGDGIDNDEDHDIYPRDIQELALGQRFHVSGKSSRI